MGLFLVHLFSEESLLFSKVFGFMLQSKKFCLKILGQYCEVKFFKRNNI